MKAFHILSIHGDWVLCWKRFWDCLGLGWLSILDWWFILFLFPLSWAALLMTMVHYCKRTQIQICQGKGCRGRVEKGSKQGGSKQGASSCPLLRECEQCYLLLVVTCDSTPAGLMTRETYMVCWIQVSLGSWSHRQGWPLTFSLSRETVMLRWPKALIISSL